MKLTTPTPGLHFISRKGKEINRLNWQVLLRVWDYCILGRARTRDNIYIEAFWHGVVHDCETFKTPFGVRLYQMYKQEPVDLAPVRWCETERQTLDQYGRSLKFLK